jgi:hypothetical protein
VSYHVVSLEVAGSSVPWQVDRVTTKTTVERMQMVQLNKIHPTDCAIWLSLLPCLMYDN